MVPPCTGRTHKREHKGRYRFHKFKAKQDGSHSLYKVIRRFRAGKPQEHVQLRDSQGRFLTSDEEQKQLEQYSQELFGTGEDFPLKRARGDLEVTATEVNSLCPSRESSSEGQSASCRIEILLSKRTSIYSGRSQPGDSSGRPLSNAHVLSDLLAPKATKEG